MTSTGALSGFFPEAEVIERKRAPKRLASYVLGARLGRGAFAKVKEAYHIDRPHIRLAIKIIDVARLRRKMMGMATHHAEIAILKTLNHPRIVQYVDSFEDTRKGKVYIALEYMPGGDLQHLIDKRDLSLAETRGVFRSLIEGLAYIHGLGIVHQDIKPSNLLINGIGAVKISDFGVAQYVEAEDLAVRTSADIPSVEGPDDGNDDDESSSYSSSESPRMVPPCHLPHPIPETILLTPTTTTTTTTTKTSKSPSTSATTTTTTTTTDGIIIAEQEPARSSSSSSSSESTTSSKKISSQLASSGGEAATSKEAASLKLASPSTGPTKTDANGRLVSSSATIQTGAPAFQPPELAGSSGVPSVHPATDIWAAGITLFRLIQGCLPFQLQEANVYQLWKVIAKGDFQIPDDLEDELRSLLTRLLEPDPKKRISAAEVLQHPWLANHADDEPLQDITFGPTLFTSETTPEKSDRTREEESGRLTGDSTLDSYDDSEDMTGADPHSRSSHDYTEPKSSPAHRRKTTHLCGFCNIQ